MAISLRGLHPEVREAAEATLEWARHYKIPVQVTSTFRSWEQQTKLRKNYERCLAEGRFPSPPDCKWPANRPGDSAHNYGLAWDSWVPDEWWWAWNWLRRYAGFHVPANDQIHAEVPQWRQYV